MFENIYDFIMPFKESKLYSKPARQNTLNLYAVEEKTLSEILPVTKGTEPLFHEESRQ